MRVRRRCRRGKSGSWRSWVSMASWWETIAATRVHVGQREVEEREEVLVLVLMLRLFGAVRIESGLRGLGWYASARGESAMSADAVCG
jgi:hypothetical protein